MHNYRFAVGVTFLGLLCGDIRAEQASPSSESQLQYIGKSVRGVPVSPAVKSGKALHVSGTPGFDKGGKLSVGDFSAQMKQAMENITDILKSSGIGWDRVTKVTVFLTRRDDFGEMNRIYTTYFPSGNYPARTTLVVSALPQPDFLLEIECEAVLE